VTFAEKAEAAGLELLRAQLPPAAPRPRVRFRGKISGRFGKGGRARDAWVEIDRAQTFHVRPYRGKTVYSLPLEVVAAWAFQKLAVTAGNKERARRKLARSRRS
jgi:hypothetical protein